MDSSVITIPKITVLMPVYNCALYIKEAVDSILDQTYSDFEFLIIDDASTDETVDLIKAFTDARIKLIQKPVNTGYTNSLNFGLSIAKGEYIARMDGDDVSLPQRFEKQVAFLDANRDIILCGTAYKIIGRQEPIPIPENHDAIKLALLKANCIAHPSIMIRNRALQDFSIVYDKATEPAEDYNMWVRLITLGKFHNLQEILLEYRIHETSVSRERKEEQEKSAIHTRIELLKHLDFNLEDFEHKVLFQCLLKNSKISFVDIKIFKQLHQRLIYANKAIFFEPVGFNQFLVHLKADVVRKCFLRQNKYSPFVFFEYLRITYKWNAGLTRADVFRLFVKCVIFYKLK